MKALIVDDEPMPGKLLQEMIKKHCFEINSTTLITSPQEALKHLQEEAYDILFLDVEMPGMNAFELLDQLQLPSHTVVIFVTAYSSYAVEAFKANAAYYVLKPVVQEELIKSVRKATSYLTKANGEQQQQEKLSIFDGDEYLIINVNEIVRLQADGSYTKIVTDKKEHLSSKRLGFYEDKLSQANFYRCHNSHIINLKSLSKISKGKTPFLTLQNGDAIPLSPKKKSELIKLVGL